MRRRRGEKKSQTLGGIHDSLSLAPTSPQIFKNPQELGEQEERK
jgi:hypothetical protein